MFVVTSVMKKLAAVYNYNAETLLSTVMSFASPKWPIHKNSVFSGE